MTKRFVLFEDLDIKDIVTGHIIPPCLDRGLAELIDLLNQLNDENEQLKQDKDNLIDFIKKEFPKSHKHILEDLE